jgi:hypothetical protein
MLDVKAWIVARFPPIAAPERVPPGAQQQGKLLFQVNVPMPG